VPTPLHLSTCHLPLLVPTYLARSSSWYSLPFKVFQQLMAIHPTPWPCQLATSASPRPTSLGDPSPFGSISQAAAVPPKSGRVLAAIQDNKDGGPSRSIEH
ncbi:hypothetical protein DSO57_1019835, partial [Entomophthora muscae]